MSTLHDFLMEEAEYFEEDSLSGYIKCRNECDYEWDIQITLDQVLYGETAFDVPNKKENCPAVCPNCYEQKDTSDDFCDECACFECRKLGTEEDSDGDKYCKDHLPDEEEEEE